MNPNESIRAKLIDANYAEVAELEIPVKDQPEVIIYDDRAYVIYAVTSTDPHHIDRLYREARCIIRCKLVATTV